jgi:hypothetical protein
MNALLQAAGNRSDSVYRSRLVKPARPGGTYRVAVPSTPMLARALPYVDWSDAYAVMVPSGPPRHPQDWADAIFHAPPLWVRLLFGVREVLVRMVGIEAGGDHVFDTVSWSPTEVLLGIDQRHLGFRASVLVEPGRVVVSTVVEVRNRRGLVYSALVRPIHPFVVRRMLARAARAMASA